MHMGNTGGRIERIMYALQRMPSTPLTDPSPSYPSAYAKTPDNFTNSCICPISGSGLRLETWLFTILNTCLCLRVLRFVLTSFATTAMSLFVKGMVLLCRRENPEGHHKSWSFYLIPHL